MVLLPYLIVITAIHFYNKPGWKTYKISYIISYDMLTSKRFSKLAS